MRSLVDHQTDGKLTTVDENSFGWQSKDRYGSICLRIGAWLAGKLCDLLTTRAIPVRFCDEVAP